MENQVLATSQASANHVSILSSSNPGAAAALTVAFKDLKRRYIQRQSEIVELTARNIKMNSELAQSDNTTHILERKIEQLQKSLQSKITAYANLEETYKQTRKHEDSLIEHCAETEKLLDNSIVKLNQYQLENSTLKEECTVMKQTLSTSILDRLKLVEQLQELKSIPEVMVDKRPSLQALSFCNCSLQAKHFDRGIQHLVSENQTLRTNVHWLSKELKATQGDKIIQRIRKDSESLETGKKHNADKTNKFDRYVQNVNRYIHQLYKTISVLKSSLEKNSKIINQLEQGLRYISSGSTYLKTYQCSTPDYLPTINCHTANNVCTDQQHESTLHRSLKKGDHLSHIQDLASTHYSTQEMLGSRLGQSSKEVTTHPQAHNEVELPPLLLENLQLQQTHTYLKSKTFPIPQLYCEENSIKNQEGLFKV